MPDTPAPAECWGLFDASGKLWIVRLSREGAEHEAKKLEPLSDLGPGWTIRRVVVSVKEES